MGACDGCSVVCLVQILLQLMGIETTLLMFALALPAVHAIIQAGDIGQENPAYYLAKFFHSAAWLMYALFSLNWGGIFLNGVGVVVQLYCLVILIIYTTGDTRQLISGVLTGLSLLAVLIGYLVFHLEQASGQSWVLGVLGCITGLIVYSVPCYYAISALLAGTVLENTNLVQVMASLVNGVVWAAYAAVRGDHFIGFLNWVCIGSALLQLGIYAWCYAKARWLVVDRVQEVPPAEEPLLDGPTSTATAPSDASSQA